MNNSIRAVLRKWLKDLDQVIFPRGCVICKSTLLPCEDVLCTHCLTLLPYTQFKARKGNRLERLFYGEIPIVRANALIFHQRGAESAALIHSIKYRDNPEAAVFMGRLMAQDLLEEAFFEGIDAIAPIPLHKKRLKQRGYNQSELLAQGVAEVVHLPIWTDVVKRIVDNPSQTQLGYDERKERTKDIFKLVKPDCVRGKHLLLIDDVITSGATIKSYMHEMEGLDVKFSVLTLGMARYSTDIAGYVGYDFEV